MSKRSLLVLSGGHPYDADAFEAFLASFDGWSVRHLVHPEAEAAVANGAAADADAMLFYDMPGYTFGDGEAKTRPPSLAFRKALLDRFASGRGAVMMHHAIAGWAEWPEWCEIVGGRFLYAPGSVRGQERLDSGYRHDVAYEARIVSDHPITQGLPATFPMTDELYLGEVFDEDVTPLVRAQHDFSAHNFYSAAHAVAGRMFDNEGWPHPPGSNLVAWAKHWGPARIAYVQCGDGPDTYNNANVRRLVANALEWTAERNRQ